MKKLYIAIAVLLGFLFGCQNMQNDEQIIEDILFEQKESWNSGDIEAFMKAYWISDSLKFIGANGVTYGYTNTLEGYKERYPTKAAMGKLEFQVVHLHRLAPDVFHMVGMWDLAREMGDIGGHFTLIWKKVDNQWVIVSDHTSAR